MTHRSLMQLDSARWLFLKRRPAWYLRTRKAVLINDYSLYTRISFHYEYASAVMMGLIFLGVKQRDAIKHI